MKTNGNAVILMEVPLTQLKVSDDGKFINFKGFQSQRGTITIGKKQYPVILSYNKVKKGTILTIPLEEREMTQVEDGKVDAGIAKLMK